MNKKDANNQLLALLAVWYFFGRRKNKKPAKYGYIPTIVYAAAILVCFSQGWAGFGFVLCLPIIIGVLIGLVPLLVQSAKSNGEAGPEAAVDQTGEDTDIVDGKL
jgi:hypothetical protein